MVDAYQDITIPFQMSSVEFFDEVKNHLSDNGVMVVNMNMYSNKSDGINAYLSDTISSVFDEVYTVKVEGSTNQELFASNNNNMLNSFKVNQENINDSELKSLMKNVYNSMETYIAGKNILTDDKAPVEVLGMDVIDSLIQDEIGYYKEIFKKNGISGLLSELS